MEKLYGKDLKYLKNEKKKKLPQNFDTKFLAINHIGSKGEGVSYLRTEINYIEKEYNFFIPFSLPNEKIIAQPTHFSSEGIRAEIIEIKKSSSDRIDPKCRHFFKCGGCTLQHWKLNNYNNWKFKKVSSPVLKLSPNTNVKPIITSSLKSRRHAKFIAKRIKSTTVVGFNEYRTNFITKINECIILDEQLVKLINNIEKPLNNLLQIGEIVNIHANLLDNGIDLLIDGLGRIPFNQFTELNQTLLQNNVIRFNRKSNNKTTDLLFITTNTSLSNKLFSSTVYPIPGGFLQATFEGETAIVNNTINALENIKKSRLICELFSGCGTITIPLLLKKFKIHAFEIDNETLKALNIAAKKHGLGNNVITKNRNLKTTPLNPEELSKFDAIIIDPPRSGAHRQFSNIAMSKVPIVVSISCNINTFIRDSKSLIENNYELKWVRPIDQFLFSSHVEIVGLFEIKKVD